MTHDETTPRILICRLSALGDTVHTLPVLCALRDRYPAAHITWAVHPEPEPVVRSHPALDETIVVPRGWLTSPRTVWRMRKMLRARQFDIAVDVQSLTKSAMLGWLSGAEQRIGFASPQGRELAPWLHNESIRPVKDHVVDRYLELLAPLGIVDPAVRFDLPIPFTEAQTIDRFLKHSHLGCDFAVLNPGAGWDSKLWPFKRYGYLARRLGQMCNLPSVVVWAGQRERDWAEQIARHSGGNALVAPSTSVLELAALARRAALLVASDSGPLHLAVAAGTPCVGIYGPTRPSECGPYGPGHRTVQAYYQGGSGRKRRGRNNRAMAAVEVDEVFDACCELLLKKKRPADLRQSG